MKKTFLVVALALLSLVTANAQTNIQLHFDTGRYLYSDIDTRQIFTTTIEHWNADRFGSNYFFVDLDFSNNTLSGNNSALRGAYTEISREWCFWKGTKLEDLSFHMEYNGGLDIYSSSYNDAWLFGPTYNFHNSDYSFTASISALYKLIPDNSKCKSNFQITGVWNYHFYHRMFSFLGFFDFWKEYRSWQGTDYIFLTEPQFWFNLNAVKGCQDVNLSFGTEVEISSNFVSKGFYAIPTVAVKYIF